jgi:hypothetical protein
MKALAILTSFLFFGLSAYSQPFRPGIKKDSLFQAILKTVPQQSRAEIETMYRKGSQMEKDFILIMFSQPTSSKTELVKNIDSNLINIEKLKSEYKNIVPPGYEVSIEIEPESKIIESTETIDIRIQKTGSDVPVFQKWNMKYGSEDLKQALDLLGWNMETVKAIKVLLVAANCISIENGEITTVGFARSGMAKYSLKLFPNDLTAAQVTRYNDGCTYIYYKKNIVLQYGGGAVGGQCFERN